MSKPPTFEQWRGGGRSFTYRGQRVFFQEHGSAGNGTTLVCLHGFPTASWDWHRLWPQLGERFGHVLAPDLLGSGWSDKPVDWAYSIFDQANLVETLLRERGVARCHLFAHDYGVSVAQEMLARHAQVHEGIALPAPVNSVGSGGDVPPHAAAPAAAIESVCFLNGGLFPETHRARLIQKLLLSPLGSLIARMTDESSFGHSLSAVFGPDTQPSATEIDEFWQLLVHGHGYRIVHRLGRYITERKANRERWVGALQRTRVPRRLIVGPEDPVSGAHMAERYHEVVPDADVVVLPGIGHYPHVEDPQGTLRAFLRFHDRLPPRNERLVTSSTAAGNSGA